MPAYGRHAAVGQSIEPTRRILICLKPRAGDLAQTEGATSVLASVALDDLNCCFVTRQQTEQKFVCVHTKTHCA